MMTSVTAARVLLADDEDDIRALLRVVLSDGSGRFEVVAEAVDGVDALERWRELKPDVVLLDQRMPGHTGLEVAAEILEENPDQAVVLFSAYLNDTMRQHAAEIGVRACIPKEDVFAIPDALAEALA